MDAFPDIPVVARLEGFAGVPPCDLGLVEAGDGLRIYVLLSPDLYERDGTPYGDADGDFGDNDLRFARLSLAAAEIAAGADPDWAADLLHLNDWQAALAPAYLAWRGRRVPSVLTIHNLAYQGLFPARRPGPPRRARGRLPDQRRRVLRPALVPEGRHLLRLARHHGERDLRPRDPDARDRAAASTGCCAPAPAQGRLAGILNGIDESWDPRTDPHLATRFEADDWKGKRANAEAVRRQFGLAVSRGPLFAIVSRLVHQKGIDLEIAGGRDDRRRGRPARGHRPGRGPVRGRAARPRQAPPGRGRRACRLRGGATPAGCSPAATSC